MGTYGLQGDTSRNSTGRTNHRLVAIEERLDEDRLEIDQGLHTGFQRRTELLRRPD